MGQKDQSELHLDRDANAQLTNMNLLAFESYTGEISKGPN